jgi:hypothetical protein
MNLIRSVSSLLFTMAFSASVALAAEGETASLPSVPPPPPAVAGGPTWVLQLPQAELVAYQGVVNLDQAGIGTQGMMYPAPDAISMLAAVVTHGVVAKSMRNKQKTALQQAADRVLEPYQPVLSRYTNEQLMQRSLQLMAAPGIRLLSSSGDPTSGSWSIESDLVFSMTQDQQAIILDHGFRVRAPGEAEEPSYVNAFRIVSRPRDVADPKMQWLEKDGAILKEESAALLAESLDILAAELLADSRTAEGTQKTVRYREGRQEMMERALVLKERCGRLLIRTLRGTLMSVPVRAAAVSADTSCQAAPPAAS